MTVYTAASMSMDGFIAGPSETGFEHLFRWLGNGPVAVPTAHTDFTLHMSPASATYFQDMIDTTGVLVVGRRLYDLVDGWGGQHPMGCPVVVVTHNPLADTDHFKFVNGIEAAISAARSLAGDKHVGVNGGAIASQCLDARLLEEIRLELVPVLLGDGVPFFSSLGKAPVLLDGPSSVVSGNDVTHLRYRVRYE